MSLKQDLAMRDNLPPADQTRFLQSAIKRRTGNLIPITGVVSLIEKLEGSQSLTSDQRLRWSMSSSFGVQGTRHELRNLSCCELAELVLPGSFFALKN